MECEATDQSRDQSKAKLMFFDEMEGMEGEEEGATRPSANIRINVQSCKREGKDWIYCVKVGAAYTCNLTVHLRAPSNNAL